MSVVTLLIGAVIMIICLEVKNERISTALFYISVMCMVGSVTLGILH